MLRDVFRFIKAHIKHMLTTVFILGLIFGAANDIIFFNYIIGQSLFIIGVYLFFSPSVVIFFSIVLSTIIEFFSVASLALDPDKRHD